METSSYLMGGTVLELTIAVPVLNISDQETWN